mmetsp:Transcript_93683/g.303325  ORF Transcript_93683/g.303325 Transcript_93683/m.303325 type:complete len:230 (-) Transcript_93683:215-904(-)
MAPEPAPRAVMPMSPRVTLELPRIFWLPRRWWAEATPAHRVATARVAQASRELRPRCQLLMWPATVLQASQMVWLASCRWREKSVAATTGSASLRGSMPREKRPPRPLPAQWGPTPLAAQRVPAPAARPPEEGAAEAEVGAEAHSPWPWWWWRPAAPPAASVRPRAGQGHCSPRPAVVAAAADPSLAATDRQADCSIRKESCLPGHLVPAGAGAGTWRRTLGSHWQLAE